jgi:hypothetical protein
VTDPGPYGGYTIRDVCACQCHRVGNPEDVMCGCNGDQCLDWEDE